MASPGVLPPPLLPYEPRSYVIAGLPTVFARLRRISVSEFDAALVANGGRPLPRTLPGWGAAFEVSVKRFRFDLAIGDTTAPVQTGSGTLSMDVLDGGLDAGYEFLRWRGLTGLALVGIEGSALRLTGQTPAWNFLGPPAASVIGSKETTLSASSAALSLQAGFDEAVPLAPIMNPWADAVAAVLSLRGGYQRSLADAGHWGTDERRQGCRARSGGFQRRVGRAWPRPLHLPRSRRRAPGLGGVPSSPPANSHAQATCTSARKFRAVFSKRVAMARKRLRLWKKHSTR